MEKVREMIIDSMMHGRFEMKPCPFCGGKPSFMSKGMFDELVEENGRSLMSITCKCGAELRDFSREYSDNGEEENDYYVRAFGNLVKWNRRVGEEDA